MVMWNLTWRLTWTRENMTWIQERVTWQAASAEICVVFFLQIHVRKDVTRNIVVFSKTSQADVEMSSLMSMITLPRFSCSFRWTSPCPWGCGDGDDRVLDYVAHPWSWALRMSSQTSQRTYACLTWHLMMHGIVDAVYVMVFWRMRDMLWKTWVMFMWTSLSTRGRLDGDNLKFNRTSMKTSSKNLWMSCKTLPLPNNRPSKHVHVTSDML